MGEALANTTTSAVFDDTTMGYGARYGQGALTIANNPVQLIITTGRTLGETRDTLYPYVSPTTVPLLAGKDEFIVGVKVRDAITGLHAQVSGWLIPLGLAGIGPGTPFTQTILANGQVIVQGVSLISAVQNVDLTLSTTDALVPGMAVTFSVSGGNARLLVAAMFDFDSGGVTGNGFMRANMRLDGVAVGLTALINDVNAFMRSTVPFTELFGVASGAHTLDFTARKTAAGGAGILRANTGMAATLLDQ